MGVWLWTAGHGAGRTMGSSFSWPACAPLFGAGSGAGCARSTMLTVRPPKRPSPRACFFNFSLLPSRWSIRCLQNWAFLHPFRPVIQGLRQWNILCFGCTCSICGRLGRWYQGSCGCLRSGCCWLDGFNSDKRLLFDIPALAWLSSAFVGEAIVMVHACHFRGNGGSSRSGSAACLDWGQRPGLYLNNLGGARLGGLSSLALSQEGHWGQGSPHLVRRSGWRS